MGAPSGGTGSGAPSARGPGANPAAPGAPTGPAVPGTPATGAQGSGLMPKTRGPTSRETLRIHWEHATAPGSAANAADGRTAAVLQRSALSPDEAMAALRGEDRRPLLVLRECLQCSGTEDALMSSKEDNERTYLLTRWFHCVKLSPDVLEADHPFRNLFPGDKPAHLFLANWDGSGRHDLEGEHSRRELWGAMEKAIAANYRLEHEPALRELTKRLDSLDELDSAIADKETRFELAVAAGERPAKVEKLRASLDEDRKRRSEILAQAVRLSQLELTPIEPAPAR